MHSKPFVFDQNTNPDEERQREPKIVGEICARLIQWANTGSRSQVTRWLDRVRFAYTYGTPGTLEALAKASPLASEVVALLSEWGADEGGYMRAKSWLNTLGAIWSTGAAGPAMLWLYISFQTGDANQIAASFETRGEAKAVPRQAAHQEFTQALANLRRLNPGLADALRELYERHSPEAAAAGGMVATGQFVVRPVAA